MQASRGPDDPSVVPCRGPYVRQGIPRQRLATCSVRVRIRPHGRARRPEMPTCKWSRVDCLHSRHAGAGPGRGPCSNTNAIRGRRGVGLSTRKKWGRGTLARRGRADGFPASKRPGVPIVAAAFEVGAPGRAREMPPRDLVARLRRARSRGGTPCARPLTNVVCPPGFDVGARRRARVEGPSRDRARRRRAGRSRGGSSPRGRAAEARRPDLVALTVGVD